MNAFPRRLIALMCAALSFVWIVDLGTHAVAQTPDDMPAFRNNDRILFQGDSITHGGRGKDPNHFMGHGYQFIIAAKYGSRYPERNLTFLNRGVSGDTVARLQERWKVDTLDLKPDLLSILVGINDLGGASAEKYEENYDRLLQETVAALPNVRLVLGEPFGLPVGAFAKTMGEWEKTRAELERRQAIVAKLGAKYKATVVHYQKVFDDACRRAPAEYWIWDGVHPTYSGHQLMADEWIRTVNAELK
jgi:lysophospholipase L1-like esterase